MNAGRPGPRNVWLVAGTSLFAPYPCRCRPRRETGTCDPTWCPDAGRLDALNFAPGCCAWWATPMVAAAAQSAYSASKGWS